MNSASLKNDYLFSPVGGPEAATVNNSLIDTSSGGASGAFPQ